jgi:hypothetical protein
LPGAKLRDGGGVVRDIEGGRGVCAVGSELSKGTAGLHAFGQRAGGTADAGRAAWE